MSSLINYLPPKKVVLGNLLYNNRYCFKQKNVSEQTFNQRSIYLGVAAKY